MKRILLALPLAGAMMTLSLSAHAQSAAPAAEVTSPAGEHDRSVTRPRGDCVDLSEGIAPTQSARDLHDSLDDDTAPRVDTDGKRNRLGSADIEQATPPADEDGENRASC